MSTLLKVALMSGGTVALRSGGTCDSGTKVAASKFKPDLRQTENLNLLKNFTVSLVIFSFIFPSVFTKLTYASKIIIKKRLLYNKSRNLFWKHFSQVMVITTG